MGRVCVSRERKLSELGESTFPESRRVDCEWDRQALSHGSAMGTSLSNERSLTCMFGDWETRDMKCEEAPKVEGL